MNFLVNLHSKLSVKFALSFQPLIAWADKMIDSSTVVLQ